MIRKKWILVLWVFFVTLALSASPRLKFRLDNFCQNVALPIHFEAVDADTVLWEADQPGYFRNTDQDSIIEFVYSERTNKLVEVWITGTAVKEKEATRISKRSWGLPVLGMGWFLNGVNVLPGDTLNKEAYRLDLCYLPAKRYLFIPLSDWHLIDSFYGSVNAIPIHKRKVLYEFTEEGSYHFEAEVRFKNGCTIKNHRTIEVAYLGDNIHKDENEILVTRGRDGALFLLKILAKEESPFTYRIFSLEGKLLGQSNVWQTHHCHRLQNGSFGQVVLVQAIFKDGSTKVMKCMVN